MLVTVVLLLGSILPCAALSADYFINKTDTCISSGLTPSEPAGLTFCVWYHKNSCCLPAIDNEILENYFSTVSLGPGCASASHENKATHREIRDLMCMPCDPHEPRFRFSTKQGDIAQGGKIPGDPTAPDGDFTWRICKSFLYGKDAKSGLWGDGGRKYDRCGFYHSPDCAMHPQYGYDPATGTWIQSPFPAQASDGHSCDPQLIIPRLEFEGTTDPAERLMQFLPMVLPVDFKFVVVDDMEAGFNYQATPCFRGSGAAGLLISIAFNIVGVLAVAAISLM